MDNERLLKKVMNEKVDGRSARGRPRFGWIDGVNRALNDRRMDMREASERARNFLLRTTKGKTAIPD